MKPGRAARSAAKSASSTHALHQSLASLLCKPAGAQATNHRQSMVMFSPATVARELAGPVLLATLVLTACGISRVLQAEDAPSTKERYADAGPQVRADIALQVAVALIVVGLLLVAWESGQSGQGAGAASRRRPSGGKALLARMRWLISTFWLYTGAAVLAISIVLLAPSLRPTGLASGVVFAILAGPTSANPLLFGAPILFSSWTILWRRLRKLARSSGIRTQAPLHGGEVSGFRD